MVSKEKSPAPVKAVLSDSEWAALLDLAKVRPAKASPLAQFKARADSNAARALQQMGLIDGSNHPTPGCLECLNILSSPGVEIDLIWGNPGGVSLSKVYAASGQDRLVSFTSVNGSQHLSFFLSPADITDLITEKTTPTEIKDAPGLAIEASPAAVPVILAVLDAYREAQLKAALERRQNFEVKVDPDEINRILQEAKLEMNMAWYAPAGNIAMPPDAAVTAATVNEGISLMKRSGIIEADGTLSTSAAAVAYRAFPLLAFCGVRTVTPAEVIQFALFRGFATLLFLQISSDNGVNKAIINSISTSDLPEILFKLATRPFEVSVPPVAVPSQAGLKYCAKCGTPVKVGGKFCEKCGAKLE